MSPRAEAMFAARKISRTARMYIRRCAISTARSASMARRRYLSAPSERMLALPATCVPAASKGQGGKITDVLNIGIGRSTLAPPPASRCRRYADGPRAHFISSVDGAQAHDDAELNPEMTLVIVASKTFTIRNGDQCRNRASGWA
ncbi:MAG: hypothetical protein R3D61_04710 [Defluviimonas denitrificans]